MSADPTRAPSRADFEPLIGSTMPITIGGHRADAELREVNRLPAPSPRPDPFALLLHVPVALPAAQGIHTLVHPTLGALELFMVPIGPVGDAMRYEVIFN